MPDLSLAYLAGESLQWLLMVVTEQFRNWKIWAKLSHTAFQIRY
jgi:hypothetical protein